MGVLKIQRQPSAITVVGSAQGISDVVRIKARPRVAG